jgi:hypothetical protein
MFGSNLQDFGILIGLYGKARGRGESIAGKTREQNVAAILRFKPIMGKFAEVAAN